jgi:hypothetical protein
MKKLIFVIAIFVQAGFPTCLFYFLQLKPESGSAVKKFVKE